jgi:hypothetical protein
LFPEYDFARVNPDEYAGVVIEQILDRGSQQEISWLFEQYGKRRVTTWVRQHGYRLLNWRAFPHWRTTLGIKRYRVPPRERGKERTGDWNE